MKVRSYKKPERRKEKRKMRVEPRGIAPLDKSQEAFLFNTECSIMNAELRIISQNEIFN